MITTAANKPGGGQPGGDRVDDVEPMQSSPQASEVDGDRLGAYAGGRLVPD
jgi:hypothetical protein